VEAFAEVRDVGFVEGAFFVEDFGDDAFGAEEERARLKPGLYKGRRAGRMPALQNERRGRRDFSLRRPTFSQERKGKKKSACCVRNEGRGGGDAFLSSARNDGRG
jgi:hypothetical protein